MMVFLWALAVSLAGGALVSAEVRLQTSWARRMALCGRRLRGEMAVAHGMYPKWHLVYGIKGQNLRSPAVDFEPHPNPYGLCPRAFAVAVDVKSP